MDDRDSEMTELAHIFIPGKRISWQCSYKYHVINPDGDRELRSCGLDKNSWPHPYDAKPVIWSTTKRRDHVRY
jgi:hypothetical protein